MTVYADERYEYTQNNSRRQENHTRKKKVLRRYFLAGLIAGALCLTALFLCWQAVQRIWSGICSAMPPADANILFVPPSPTEITCDTQPPKLSGIRNLAVYQGGSISWLNGITATDDRDPTPGITVDTDSVDLDTPGDYTITYTATDASGNSSQATATVSVLEKQDGYQDLETIYAEADALLAEILQPEDSLRQQVKDIYVWARMNLSYGGHSDRDDWRQTAYGMLTEGRGDCYGYWAVTKLLFERLGIPNIDVQKVRNYPDDSDHFWSLVSLDGGESWYHFDATPRYGDGDDFCLVTDAFLDAYSDSHKGSHNRDKSLYPATP